MQAPFPHALLWPMTPWSDIFHLLYYYEPQAKATLPWHAGVVASKLGIMPLVLRSAYTATITTLGTAVTVLLLKCGSPNCIFMEQASAPLTGRLHHAGLLAHRHLSRPHLPIAEFAFERTGRYQLQRTSHAHDLYVQD